MSKIEPPAKSKGRVHLYVGDGKGKTTAAAGLAIRFLSGGGRVFFCRFLKGCPSGEVAALERLGAEVRSCQAGSKFYFQMDEAERNALKTAHRACLAEAARAAEAGVFGLLVLDEVVDAVNLGVLEEKALLSLLAGRSPAVEVVLTGRKPSEGIVAAADYYTEFLCRRHPYSEGLAARPGIEF